MGDSALTADEPLRPPPVPYPIVALVVAAWAVAIAGELGGLAGALHHDALAVGGLPAIPAELDFLASWTVMVAAMMLPTSFPLMRLFARASRDDRAIAAFLGGYVVVWAAFGSAAFVADLGLHAAVSASPALEERSWALGGGVLLLAGAFQFTSLKRACLNTCWQPTAFMVRYFRPGPRAGFSLGASHGVFCVGCCWALMLVMFAVGTASLIWMALLTALMVLEKARPPGARTVPVTGIALLGLGSTVLLSSAYASGAL